MPITTLSRSFKKDLVRRATLGDRSARSILGAVGLASSSRALARAMAGVGPASAVAGLAHLASRAGYGSSAGSVGARRSVGAPSARSYTSYANSLYRRYGGKRYTHGKRKSRQYVVNYDEHIGGGLPQHRRIEGKGGKKKRSVRITKKFRTGVKKVITNMKDQHTRMYLLKNTGGAGGTAPTITTMTATDLTSRIDRSNLYTPTGLDYASTTQANIERAIFKGGYTLFPLNVCQRVSALTQDVALPDAEQPEIRYQGESFDPTYLVADYGWKEGSAFFQNEAYGRTELCFGVIKDASKVLALMTAHSWTIEELINRVLGHPARRDESVHGSDWPYRACGDIRATEDNEAKAKSLRQVRGLIKILKRDTLEHRSVTADKPDGVDGEAHQSSNELDILFGSGSFKFPQSELKKQERLEVVAGDADPVTDFRSKPNQLCYKKNVPFIHMRGCAIPDADPNPQLSANFASGMALALRWKVSIMDDE